MEEVEVNDESEKLKSPPSLSSVKIVPEPAYVDSSLSVVIGAGLDKDKISYTFKWFKNVEKVGGDSDSLKGVEKSKGDNFLVKVIPFDGKDEGAPLRAETVIVNSPPHMESARIEPDPAYTDDDLNALGKASDKDGDDISFTCKWRKNGEVIKGVQSCKLSKDRIKSGDIMSVQIVPSDGDEEGLPQKSPNFLIANSPPTILSSPSLSLSKEGLYSYQVVAQDIDDDDPLEYGLVSGPDGMEIDQEGLLLWKIGKEKKGKYNIQVKVSDGSGGKVLQSYNLTISEGKEKQE